MRARACVAATLAVLAAPIALAGTLEACRTAPPEAGGALLRAGCAQVGAGGVGGGRIGAPQRAARAYRRA